MTRISLGIVVVAAVLVAVCAPPAGAAAFLTTSEARSEAESAATTFRYRHQLDESHVTVCRRLSKTQASCTAIAKGEGAASTIECTLRIAARIPVGNIFATAVIESHSCTKTPRPMLTYAEAHGAIQGAADAFAGTATTITAMRRKILSFEEGGEGAFEGTARWERPALRPTAYDPTESCSVEVTASMVDGKIATSTEGFDCY
jgi:hypothetical protein